MWAFLAVQKPFSAANSTVRFSILDDDENSSIIGIWSMFIFGVTTTKVFVLISIQSAVQRLDVTKLISETLTTNVSTFLKCKRLTSNHDDVLPFVRLGNPIMPPWSVLVEGRA